MRFQQILLLVLLATVSVAYDDAEEKPKASLRGGTARNSEGTPKESDFGASLIDNDQKHRKTQSLPIGFLPINDSFTLNIGTRPPFLNGIRRPTQVPTSAPAQIPTLTPTRETVTTPVPTSGPSLVASPTLPPTQRPTLAPVSAPTIPIREESTPVPTSGPSLVASPTHPPTQRPTLAPVSAPTIPIREESFDGNGNRCGMSTPGTIILHGGTFNYEDPMSDHLGQTIVREMRSTPGNRILDPLVFIPGARRDVSLQEEIEFENQWQNIMAPGVPFTVLHPNNAQPDFTNVADAAQADTIGFVTPLNTAMGVFLPGGRQYRLIDAYKYTRTEEELWGVLHRGGVIAGTSAGAAVMGDVMPRGDPSGSSMILAEREWHQHGFGFVSNIAIDNHVDRRGRELDMYDVLNDKPENRKLLGIGLNEDTSIVVKGKYFHVIGESVTDSVVRVYDCSSISLFQTCTFANAPYQTLTVGSWYDLCDRRQLSSDPLSNEELSITSTEGSYARPWYFGSDFKAGNPNKFICSGRKCRFLSNPIVIDHQDGALVRVSGKLFSIGTEFKNSDRITVQYRLNDDETWSTLFTTPRTSASGSPSGVTLFNAIPAPAGESIIQIKIEAETDVEGTAEFQLVDLTLQ